MSRSSHPEPSRLRRRTEGVRVQGRSGRVVGLVLTAVAEELGDAGYENLRVESVATRSGVNKTTVYRRWPTKSQLVTAAIEHLKEEERVFDTGSLRGDLLAYMRDVVARMRSPIGRGLVRMVQSERAHPEITDLLRGVRHRTLCSRAALFERAVVRGEIPRGSDTMLLAELSMAPLLSRVVHVGIEADERFLEVLVDTVVAGARAGSAVHRPKS